LASPGPGDIHELTSFYPAKGPSLITRVTRLYNGTIADCRMNFCRMPGRAGAGAIGIDVEDIDGVPTLSICDDGCGIDDPHNLLTLGQSG
jgi:hypothetical protein